MTIIKWQDRSFKLVPAEQFFSCSNCALHETDCTEVDMSHLCLGKDESGAYQIFKEVK